MRKRAREDGIRGVGRLGAIAVAVAALATGCGGGGSSGGGSGSGGTSNPSTPLPPPASPTAPPAVVDFSPTAARASQTSNLEIVFNKAVVPTSIVHDGSQASTVFVAEDRDQNPGGQFDLIVGSVDLDATGRRLLWTPPNGFRPDREIRLVLTDGVQDKDGRGLVQGSVSSPISFGGTVSNAVFEGRFLPEADPAPAPAPAPSPNPPSPPPSSTPPPPPPSNPNPPAPPPPSNPNPPAPPPPAPAPAPSPSFVVVDIAPSHGQRPSNPREIRILFSTAVNPSSITPPNQQGTSVAFLQDRDTNQGGSHDMISGSVDLVRNGRELVFSIRSQLRNGRDVVIALTNNLRDVNGNRLGQGRVSAPLTAQRAFPNQVFESRFNPRIQTSTPAPPPPSAPPPAPTPTPAPAPTPTGSGNIPDPSSFVLEANTDPWYLDFVQRQQSFVNDMNAHGLLSGDNTVDNAVYNRVVHQVLRTASLKYFRSEDGRRRPGNSLAISFTTTRPSGTPGRSFSRMAVGGSSGGSALGVASLDPGNRRREDNSGGRLGVFSRSIFGMQSRLRTSVRSSDRKFVDGTYRLGDGSRAEDDRFRSIRTVIADWGQSIGTVLAHEVGHSVGLGHDDRSRNIMNSAASPRMMSDPNSTWSRTHTNTLANNLGVQR